MTKKNESTELAELPSESALAELRDSFPAEQGFQAVQLPRIGFKSQDVTHDEKDENGKKKVVIDIEAGTFLDEYPTEDIDPETDKKVWAKDELGKEIEVIIAFKRKQLRFYDEGAKKYTSSPIFDTDEESVPLFCDKTEVARGTMKELQARYMGVNKRTGKPQSDLEENVILYVLHNGVLKQLNLRGSSMFAFKSYARKTLVPGVLTHITSEEKENGSVSWNQMVFTAKRQLDADEVDNVLNVVRDLKQGIAMQKAYFGAQDAPETAAEGE